MRYCLDESFAQFQSRIPPFGSTYGTSGDVPGLCTAVCSVLGHLKWHQMILISLSLGLSLLMLFNDLLKLNCQHRTNILPMFGQHSGCVWLFAIVISGYADGFSLLDSDITDVLYKYFQTDRHTSGLHTFFSRLEINHLDSTTKTSEANLKGPYFYVKISLTKSHNLVWHDHFLLLDAYM